jgi:hypothetical protein
MSCSKHLLFVNWKQHEWVREVTHEQPLEETVTDMWGQSFSTTHVQCHTRYVCKECGAVTGERECTCELEQGERCAIRLEHLDRLMPL